MFSNVQVYKSLPKGNAHKFVHKGTLLHQKHVKNVQVDVQFVSMKIIVQFGMMEELEILYGINICKFGF